MSHTQTKNNNDNNNNILLNHHSKNIKKEGLGINFF